MAETQDFSLFYDGNPIPQEIALQEGYCSNDYIYDHEQEDEHGGHPSSSDADAEDKLRRVIESNGAQQSEDLLLKAKLLMLRAIHQYCNDAATSDPTVLQAIKYEEHQYWMSSQTAQIDKRFRELCREPFPHLVDHHGDFGQYESRMLQHLVFRYTRRTAGSDSKLVLVGHRIDHTPSAVNGF